MTEVSIDIGDPRDPQVTALLQASHALMQDLFPAESNHYLSIDALCAPGIRFFVARTAADIRGCAALAVKVGYGEVKSMFVDPDVRGAGIAARLLTRIEAEARDLSLPCLRLETGNLLAEAHRLYHRHGFKTRGPFGDYRDDPLSLFMEKSL